MASYNVSLKNLVYPLFFLEWVYLYFAEITTFNGVLLGLSWFVFTLWQVVLSYRQNILWLMVVWAFMMTYSFEPVRYFAYGETLSYRVLCETDYTAYQVALICYLFNLCIGYFTRLRLIDKKSALKPRIQKAPLYVWLLCVGFGTYCMVFGQTGDTIFESGGYGRGTQTFSSLFGYGIIPIVVAFRYSYNRIRKILVSVLIGAYTIKTLMYGGRIDAVMLVIALYTLYFYSIFSRRSTIIFIFVGYLFTVLWGEIRSSVNNVNFSQKLSETTTNLSLSNGNSADVYYASERIIYLIKTGVLSIEERILSFMYFIESTVMPSSSLPDLATLASYKTARYSSGGGGLAPVFIYAWLGLPGVILIGSLLGKAFSRFISGRCGEFLFFYTIFVIATVPRWYAYYPVQLTKFCIYGALFAFGMEILRSGHIPSLLSKGRRK